MRPFLSLRNGEDQVLADLYARHAGVLLTHLRANVRAKEDAEDLLLDVFVAALERDSLRGLSAEEQRFWLWRVTRNKLVDYYRRQARRQHLTLEEVSERLDEDAEHTPELTVLHHEEHRRLLEALEALPPLQKEVILLRFVNDLRIPEIAHILGKRETAIRMILFRALNKLRIIFEKWRGKR